MGVYPMVSPQFARTTDRPEIHWNKGERRGRDPILGSYTGAMDDHASRPGSPPPFGGFGSNRIHVVTLGRRMHQGWQRIDRGSPAKRFLTGLLVLVLAIPILLLAVFLVLLLAAIGLASALVTFMLGGRSKPEGGYQDADRGDRENVRVIPPKS